MSTKKITTFFSHIDPQIANNTVSNNLLVEENPAIDGASASQSNVISNVIVSEFKVFLKYRATCVFVCQCYHRRSFDSPQIISKRLLDHLT